MSNPMSHMLARTFSRSLSEYCLWGMSFE